MVNTSLNLYPVVDAADEESMKWGVPQMRYIAIPADYDSSVGAYNERKQIIGTSNDLEKMKMFVEGCKACGVFNFDDVFIFDTEKEEFIDD